MTDVSHVLRDEILWLAKQLTCTRKELDAYRAENQRLIERNTKLKRIIDSLEPDDPSFQRYLVLQEQLQSAREERNHYINDAQSWHGAWVESQERVKALTKALEEYGVHHDECTHWKTRTARAEQGNCTCGLSSALTDADNIQSIP